LEILAHLYNSLIKLFIRGKTAVSSTSSDSVDTEDEKNGGSLKNSNFRAAEKVVRQ